MLHTPLGHGPDNRPQILPLGRQPVFFARRVRAVALRRDNPAGDEPFQPVGEDVGRNPFLRFEELGEPPLPPHQVSDDEQRPAVAEDIERARHGTA